MSYSSNKGYMAEHALERYYQARGYEVRRPRTTSQTNVDTGDLAGMPLVQSVKNHARIQLAAAVDEMCAMVARSQWDTGLLYHKRIGKGQPGLWYVTTTVDLAQPLIDAYVRGLYGDIS